MAKKGGKKKGGKKRYAAVPPVPGVLKTHPLFFYLDDRSLPAHGS